MALKDNWKDTGKELGHAFGALGKTLVKTAKYAVDQVEDWATGSDNSAGQNSNADSCVNDDSNGSNA